MRTLDKLKNIQKANMLAEQRYLNNKNNNSPLYEADSLLTEESYNDLFTFLEQDPQKMTGAVVMCVNAVKTNKNYIDDNGNKAPNPMYDKIFKHTRFRFAWENTYAKAMERINPEYEIGARKGDYQKIQGYNMLEIRNNTTYLPILPTGSESVYSVSENGGRSFNVISKDEAYKYMPSVKPSEPSGRADYRQPLVDKIYMIKAGGNVWENPNFTYGEYLGPK